MSSRDDDGAVNRPQQLIYERQERLEEVLDIFSQRAANIELTPQMKREIAVHIVNYHRVLSQYRGESVLEDGDIADISPIRTRLGQTTTVVGQRAGRDRGTERKQVPAVDELGFWELEEIARDLEAAAKKLGFWADAKSQTDVFGVDPDWDGEET